MPSSNISKCGKSYKKTIRDTAQLYDIPDLSAAISNFILRVSHDPTNSHINSVGGQRRVHHDHLPVSHLQIWKKLRIQTTSYHHPHNKLAPYTLNADHPSPAWPHGCFDSAVFNIDPSKRWPWSGISGQCLATFEKWVTHSVLYRSCYRRHLFDL